MGSLEKEPLFWGSFGKRAVSMQGLAICGFRYGVWGSGLRILYIYIGSLEKELCVCRALRFVGSLYCQDLYIISLIVLFFKRDI